MDKNTYIINRVISVLEAYRTDLDIDIGFSKENIKFYNTALLLLLVSHFNLPDDRKLLITGDDPYVEISLVRGHVYYPEMRLLLFDHEWIKINQFVLDLTIDRLINPTLVKLGFKPINNLLLKFKKDVTTHFPVMYLDMLDIENRMDTPIQLTDGSKVMLGSYLKNLVLTR